MADIVLNDDERLIERSSGVAVNWLTVVRAHELQKLLGDTAIIESIRTMTPEEAPSVFIAVQGAVNVLRAVRRTTDSSGILGEASEVPAAGMPEETETDTGDKPSSEALQLTETTDYMVIASGNSEKAGDAPRLAGAVRALLFKVTGKECGVIAYDQVDSLVDTILAATGPIEMRRNHEGLKPDPRERLKLVLTSSTLGPAAERDHTSEAAIDQWLRGLTKRLQTTNNHPIDTNAHSEPELLPEKPVDNPQIATPVMLVPSQERPIEEEPPHVQIAHGLQHLLSLENRHKLALEAFLNPKNRNEDMTASKQEVMARLRREIRVRFGDLQVGDPRTKALSESEHALVARLIGWGGPKEFLDDKVPIAMRELIAAGSRNGGGADQVMKSVYRGLAKIHNAIVADNKAKAATAKQV